MIGEDLIMRAEYGPLNIGFSPIMGKNPSTMHCAYHFSDMYELEKRPELRDERAEAWWRSFQERFPSQETISTVLNTFNEKFKLYKKFTGLDEAVGYYFHGAEDRWSTRMTIDHYSTPFAPSLLFEVKFNFLSVDLHNCATAPLAVVMYTNGFLMLHKLYDAYGIRTDLLPTMTIDENGLEINVPMKIPKEETIKRHDNNFVRKRILAYASEVANNITVFPETEDFGRVVVAGVPLELLLDSGDKTRGKFSAVIPMNKRNRNQIAIDLLTIAAIQRNPYII